MLKPQNRLAKTKEIDQVFKKGRSSFGRITGTKLLKNDLSYNRFCVIVGTKVSKKAVVRNRIKRQIRAFVREAENDLKNGYDCLIIALPPILDKDYADISRSLREQFARLNFIKTKNTLKHK